MFKNRVLLKPGRGRMDDFRVKYGRFYEEKYGHLYEHYGLFLKVWTMLCKVSNVNLMYSNVYVITLPRCSELF